MQSTLAWLYKDNGHRADHFTPSRFAQNNRKGAVSLHSAACQHGEDAVGFVVALVKADPAAARAKDAKGRTSLHLAVSAQPADKYGVLMITTLLGANPHAAQVGDAKGQMPVNVADQRKFPLPASCVELLQTAAEGRWQPLAWLCEKIHRTTAIEAAELERHVAMCPHFARDQLQRWRPLHHAVAGQIGEHAVTVVEQLLQSFPDAAKMLTRTGCLPLHLAAQFQTAMTSCLAIVKLLLRVYPDAAKVKDRKGRLALHIAAATQHGEHGAEVLKALLDVYEDALREKDEDGRLPLAYAPKHNGLVQMLQPSPAATTSGEKGKTQALCRFSTFYLFNFCR